MTCDFAAIERDVEARLTPYRYAHTMRVTETALRLGKPLGVPEKKLRLAGVLHDCAKCMSSFHLLKTVVDFGIVIGEVERHETALLHAPVGAELAREEFGVTDTDVLAAIRYHTTGRWGMSRLEKVIWLADYMEPGRQFDGVDQVRAAADEDVDKAMLLALTNSIEYLLEQKRLIHRDTMEARNDLLLRMSH